MGKGRALSFFSLFCRVGTNIATERKVLGEKMLSTRILEPNSYTFALDFVIAGFEFTKCRV